MGCKTSSFENDGNQVNNISIRTRNFVIQNVETMKSQYKPGKKIGEGDFAKVFSVTHLKTNTKRAMKIIKIEKLQEIHKDVKPSEVFILGALDHPNIQKVYEYFTDGKYYYIILEYIEGYKIEDYLLQKSNLTEEIISKLFYQIISGIFYLHQNNIIYSNINENNIFIIIDTSSVKITGFTLSRFIHKGKKFAINYSKNNNYLAPEVLKGNYSIESDIWSCGILLYKLLTTKLPFKNISAYKGQCKEYKDKPEYQKLTSNAKDLLSKMLEVNPEKRIKGDNILKHKWFTEMKLKEEKENHFIIIDQKGLTQERLKLATEAYIIHQMENNKLINKLRESFRYYDKSGDGLINKEELKQMIDKIWPCKCSQYEINQLMNKIDQDCSGTISFEEFLRATLECNTVITRNNLENAFNFFDKDKSGKLSFKEIKEIFKNDDGDSNNNKQIDKYIEEILNQFDLDKDGEINFEEFLNLISKCK